MVRLDCLSLSNIGRRALTVHAMREIKPGSLHCAGEPLGDQRGDVEAVLLQHEHMAVAMNSAFFEAQEGDIDTGHLSFLHLGAVKPEDTKPGSFDYYNVADRAPRYEVVDTPFGTSKFT